MINCPHCDGLVEISAVNCSIFRHGLKADGQQLEPHAPKHICELQTAFGCGKPFFFHPTHGIKKCDYI
jgi:hypothetical protein